MLRSFIGPPTTASVGPLSATRATGVTTLEVALWDGKTKYKIDESEEDRKRRLAAWENYIQGDDEEDNHNGKREATEGPEMRNFMAEKSQGNTAATRESFAFPQKRQKLTECAE
ncbi:unnamed protein product [Heligmosomoides polygyrus]|uniref:Expressed conserved protein n=1 Tax=Heligmosomoides polygyrus TaxID=6339 RepID=A0A183GB13_HELPZ|nr:unnamed protein product [Heligmosomoides polygyrus]